MTPRALDHIVWPTRDLDALARTFTGLGFTVGRCNRHPWGTVNHIVQFDGCFLELLGFADDYRAVPPDHPAHAFTAFCTAALAEAAGAAAMIVLRSDDAAADAARFKAEGLGPGRMLPFSRAAQGPDGRDRTVAFTVAFADLPGLPEIGAFTCQHHRPENFWDHSAQRHANGATGIVALAVEAPDPASAGTALRTFIGSTEGCRSEAGPTVQLANSIIAIGPTKASDGAGPGRARLTEVRFAVDDASTLIRVLETGGIPFSTRAGRLLVPAQASGGTDLVFSPASS